MQRRIYPYIGHSLTSEGVRVDPSKVEAILQMTKPEDVQGVRRILEMTNYLAKERPIAYASRALTSTETSYAQIEKELLSIVFGAERFHQYTYGRKVIVDSGHKPLETIFGKPLATAPRRLQKMFKRAQKCTCPTL